MFVTRFSHFRRYNLRAIDALTLFDLTMPPEELLQKGLANSVYARFKRTKSLPSGYI